MKKHANQRQKPSYPDETSGSRLAAKGRQMANSLTAEQRREHFRNGLARIYGGAALQEAVSRH